VAELDDWERLAPWRDAPGSAGVLTDYDGTVAPIVDQPEAAVPLPGTAEVLTALARRHPMVAVVSGRPVAYLLDRLGPLPGVTMVGLYGLERAEGGTVRALPEADRWRPVVAQVTSAATAAAPPGVSIEPKGLTVGIHFRLAPREAGWATGWAAEQAARTGLVVHHGKMSLELVPPVSTDKGVVTARLSDGLKAVCFLGDDLGDLPAFDVLTRLALRGVATLSIAVRSPESPPQVLRAADLVVDGPEGALAFMQRLAAAG
jgi:trehalose 6-phosphate phosphatase